VDRDWYVVLGVPRGAPDEAIKLAYRELALIHHPDRNPGNRSAANKFMLVKEAYETLSDPNERRLHDQELKVREGKTWAPKPPRPDAPSEAPDAPPGSRKPRGRGLSDQQILSRGLIVAGALLAGRGFLGVYVAPYGRWLSLSGGQNEGFLLFLAGIALAIFGLGR
jgi:curved DNA-binding protein CbpA